MTGKPKEVEAAEAYIESLGSPEKVAKRFEESYSRHIAMIDAGREVYSLGKKVYAMLKEGSYDDGKMKELVEQAKKSVNEKREAVGIVGMDAFKAVDLIAETETLMDNIRVLASSGSSHPMFRSLESSYGDEIKDLLKPEYAFRVEVFPKLLLLLGSPETEGKHPLETEAESMVLEMKDKIKLERCAFYS